MCLYATQTRHNFRNPFWNREKKNLRTLTRGPPGAPHAEPCALWCALLAALRSCTFTIPSSKPERPER